MADGRRRAAPLALVALVLVLAGCGGGRPGPAPPERHVALGVVVNTQGYGDAMGHEQDLVVDTGVRWLREELFFNEVEPRPGVYRWAGFDRMLIAASRRGLRVLPLINQAPAWAAAADGGVPTDPTAYGDFVGAAVRRYGPAGTFWRAHPELPRRLAPRWFELFNEPYLRPPLDSSEAAGRYARLAAAGIAAGRAADPQARFLISVDAPSFERPLGAQRWLDRMLAAQPRLLAQADGVAAHPYGDDGRESVRALQRLVAALRAHGRIPPIWVTEVGWSTCDQAEGCVTETQQAHDLSAFSAGLRATLPGRVAAVFLYSLQDLRAQLGQREGSFGVLRVDDGRKPSWAVLRRISKLPSW